MAFFQEPQQQQQTDQQMQQQASAMQQQQQQFQLQQQATAYLGQQAMESAAFNYSQQAAEMGSQTNYYAEQWAFFNRNNNFEQLPAYHQPRFDFSVNQDYQENIKFHPIRVLVAICEQIDKMQGRFELSNFKNYLFGACKMVENYAESRMFRYSGIDKYYHCMANCESSEFGEQGTFIAKLMSDIQDVPMFTDAAGKEDQRANKFGRENTFRCQSSCTDNYLPKRYRK